MRITEIIWRDSVDSTNTQLKIMAQNGEVQEGSVLAALQQTGGRGRFDRKWISPAGKNLIFSVYFRTEVGFPALASVPMAAALGVRSFLQSKDILAKCKWPNDLMVGEKKICGILSERFTMSKSGSDKKDVIILGIGLNLNMDAAELALIDKPATSVFAHNAKIIVIEQALGELLPEIEKWLNIWEQGGFSAISSDWKRHCWHFAQEVSIGDGCNVCRGVLYDFGSSGEIILRLPDGKFKTIWSGDVEV